MTPFDLFLYVVAFFVGIAVGVLVLAAVFFVVIVTLGVIFGR